jgi:transcriptional regulator with XRE-family HTH domain
VNAPGREKGTTNMTKGISTMTHPVDTHVGKRIRLQRWTKGVTQQQLAENVGIKFQQIQKYETGANRVSASRLYDIAAALGVPISFFFEGLDGSDTPAPTEMDPKVIRHSQNFNSLSSVNQAAVATITTNLLASGAQTSQAA